MFFFFSLGQVGSNLRDPASSVGADCAAASKEPAGAEGFHGAFPESPMLFIKEYTQNHIRDPYMI